jgi:hypothetical protein
MVVCRTREGPAMAEYVRRKRPPASHPYWARLHDRAHPPSLLLPVAVPGVIGILIGYYGGSRPPYPLSSAVLDACKYAAMFAGVIFALGGLVAFHDSSRHTPLRERLATGLISGLLVGLVVYILAFFGFGLFLTWLSMCTGLGVWLGMLVGSLIGGVPGALFAGITYRNWRERQRHWPRWERMQRRHRQQPLAVTMIPPAEVTGPALEPEPPKDHGLGTKG